MVGVTGDPELMHVVSEAQHCARLLKLKAVRRDRPVLQMLLDRLDSVCTLLMQAAEEGALLISAHQLPILLWYGLCPSIQQ